MSSPSTPDNGPVPQAAMSSARRQWSLTRRMALIFALTTSVILTFYGAWNGYLLCTALRTELMELIEHETRELVFELEETDGNEAAVRHIVKDVQEVSVKPGCAYVVRNRRGDIVAQAGAAKLLDSQDTNVPAGTMPGLMQIMGTAPLSTTRSVAGLDLQVKLIIDASPTRATLLVFLRSMVLSFMVALGLAALAGWYTAWRGLAGLRMLVAQTRSIDVRSVHQTDARPRLQLDGAPEELHSLGLELDAMLERIDGGLGQMRTFTAGLAHELRSPLQNLIGETEVMLMAPREGDDYRSLLRSNLEDLSDLSDAIDNLITWCRTNDPARQKGAHESFDVAAEARLRLERERRSAARDGVTLEFDATGDTTLVADREAALRVLRNLVANAIAWSPPGTTVSVRIDGQTDRIAMRVEDKGPGIPQELGERVFLPFVSGRQQRGRRGGYGLGLAICRSIMDDHGGSLRFETREQGGTRFTAEFPRVSRAPDAVPQAAPPAASRRPDHINGRGPTTAPANAATTGQAPTISANPAAPPQPARS